MALNRFAVHVAFACVVTGLALTAGTFLYINSNPPNNQPAEPAGAPGGQVSENRPPIDAAGRLKALEQLAAKEPQNPDYPTQMANLYYDLGQYDKAADFYRQSLDIRPHDPNVETDLATCLHYLGQHDRALEILDKVLKYSPGFPQAMFNKGIVLAGGKNDVKGAIAIWEDLLRSNPNYPQKAELERRINELKASAR